MILRPALLWAIFALLIQFTATPAHAQPDRYHLLLRRLQGLNSTPYARMMQIGKSVNGRPIYAMTLTHPDGQTQISDRTRVLLICGQHGDEPTSTRAMVDLANQLAVTSNPYHISLLKRVVVVLVPVANPDGFAISHRLNKHHIDLNRDWANPTQPETIAITRLIEEIQPHAIIDEHEWTATSSNEPNCIEVAGFGDANNQRLSRLLAVTGTMQMSKHGMSLRPVYYHETKDNSLAHRHFSNMGICSMLVETSPRWPYTLRYAAYKDLTMALLAAIAFPPNNAVEKAVKVATSKAGNPSSDIAGLYSVEETPDFTNQYLLALLAVACYVLIRCVGSRKKAETTAAIPTAVRYSHGRRLSVTDAVQLNAPTRIKLGLLKIHKPRPTERTGRKSYQSEKKHSISGSTPRLTSSKLRIAA